MNGHGSLNRLSGLSILEFGSCREQVTVFSFRCTSSPAQGGPVRTSALGTQYRWAAGNAPKIEFLTLRAKFKCAGALEFYLEGFLIGRLNRGQCNSKSSEYRLEPLLIAHGGIGNGPAYDVYVDAEVDTFRLPTPWWMTFRQDVMLDC